MRLSIAQNQLENRVVVAFSVSHLTTTKKTLPPAFSSHFQVHYKAGQPSYKNGLVHETLSD